MALHDQISQLRRGHAVGVVFVMVAIGTIVAMCFAGRLISTRVMDGLFSMTRRRVFVLIMAVLVAGTIVAALVPDISWRLQVLSMKAAGKIPDLGWTEIAKMLVPRSGYYLRDLITDPNPYAVITNPFTSAEALADGAHLFNDRYADCHGLNGRGGNGPWVISPCSANRTAGALRLSRIHPKLSRQCRRNDWNTRPTNLITG